MKTKVFLVRHGETEWNRLGKFQGCIDTDLSKEGIIQAHSLSKRFGDNFDYIYTSPLKRAIETAKIISSAKGITPQIKNGIREINFGQWEGLTIKQISENFPEEFKIWRNDKLSAPMCGGDLSLKNACERSSKAIKEIAADHKEKRIIIVAHGGIIKAGLIGIFGWDMTMYHKMKLSNTAVCEIDFDYDLNPTIITINDTSHLPKITLCV